MSDFRLKVFYIAAKNLSFTKAAKELFVSQPAVTKHIQELETAYQARLFDRTGNKLALTRPANCCCRTAKPYFPTTDNWNTKCTCSTTNTRVSFVWVPALQSPSIFCLKYWRNLPTAIRISTFR